MQSKSESIQITDTDRARAFDRLLLHLRENPAVQNIDMMNLAGFCRNCLSTWLSEAVAESGRSLSKSEARAFVYGMPFEDWKAQHQREAQPEQLKAFAGVKPNH
jgi:uncharacterized protein